MKTVWILMDADGIVGVWPGDDRQKAMDFAERLFPGCQWEQLLDGDWQLVQRPAVGQVNIVLILLRTALGCGDPIVCRDRYHVDADGKPLPAMEAAQ